jgi:hypothetical protein
MPDESSHAPVGQDLQLGVQIDLRVGASGDRPPRVDGEAGAAVYQKIRLGTSGGMGTLLWILAVVLVVAGIVSIVRGQLLWGIVLIIVGLLVGPGGVSIFT